MFLTLLLTACTVAAPPPRPTVTAPHGIRGYRSVHALFYVVPVGPADGVVLVDAGFENDGTTVRAAVGRRHVLGILLTHAHADHWAGAHHFPEAPVYVGRGDVERIQGTVANRAPLAWLGERLLPRPEPPRHLVAVDDGARLCFQQTCFQAVAMPGHTPGSTAWLMHNVLFSGDAPTRADVPGALLALVGEDGDAARASVRRLAGLTFDVILDGHNGMQPRTQLAAPP